MFDLQVKIDGTIKDIKHLETQIEKLTSKKNELETKLVELYERKKNEEKVEIDEVKPTEEDLGFMNAL